MCTAKAPKAPKQEPEKPVQYLSNPWVDGLGISGSQARGRNSLRSDAPARLPVTAVPPGATVVRPPGGGGWTDPGSGNYQQGRVNGGWRNFGINLQRN